MQYPDLFMRAISRSDFPTQYRDLFMRAISRNQSSPLFPYFFTTHSNRICTLKGVSFPVGSDFLRRED